MKAIYPGSFDPITNGHLNIIERASKICDELTVAILVNPNKKSFFTIDERIEIIKETTKNIKNVKVDSFSGLLADYARKINANVIVRGLRAVSDFEYEMQMSLINQELNNNIDTIFLCADTEFTFLSSSIVKEVFTFFGDISNFVPKNVYKAMYNKYPRGNK